MNKCIMFFTKILSSTTVFNVDNNKKCFLSSKSAYYNDFCRNMWHWSNGCWNFSCINPGINYIFKYIKIENSYFKLYSYVKIFHNMWLFWPNKCRIGKHKRLLSKILTDPRLFNSCVHFKMSFVCFVLRLWNRIQSTLMKSWESLRSILFEKSKTWT